MDAVNAIPPYFVKICVDIFLPSTPGLLKGSLFFASPHYNNVHAPPLLFS
jgi:hypothetical protein